MAEINDLQNELSRICASVPDKLMLTDQSIARYMASPERYGYIFLHSHIAASHLDLYRFALPGTKENSTPSILRKLPGEFLAKSQKQAVAYAISLARFCNAVQDAYDKLPAMDGLGLAGDCTVSHMTTHCLRVLLIALEHDLYQDLTEHTTAPLWRNEPASAAHIRDLIDGMLRMSEAWCDILEISRQAVCASFRY
jgi:hypothetical protein